VRGRGTRKAAKPTADQQGAGRDTALVSHAVPTGDGLRHQSRVTEGAFLCHESRVPLSQPHPIKP